MAPTPRNRIAAQASTPTSQVGGSATSSGAVRSAATPKVAAATVAEGARAPARAVASE